MIAASVETKTDINPEAQTWAEDVRKGLEVLGTTPAERKLQLSGIKSAAEKVLTDRLLLTQALEKFANEPEKKLILEKAITALDNIFQLIPGAKEPEVPGPQVVDGKLVFP